MEKHKRWDITSAKIFLPYKQDFVGVLVPQTSPHLHHSILCHLIYTENNMRHLNGIPCRNFLYFVSFSFYLKNKDNCFISLPLDTLKVTFKKENAGNLFSIVRIIIRSFVTGFT